MGRVNVYLSDDLAALIERELPGLNLSAVLQEALRGRLECSHDELACTRCAAKVDRPAMVDEVLSRFYVQCLLELEPLVDVRGTAEGAAQLLKRVAVRWGLARSTAPLPRPARAAARGNRRTYPKFVEPEIPADRPAA